MSDQDKEKELAQAQAQQDALERAQALAEMGLEDPDDENWERKNPYDYMPYLVAHPKGSAKEIEAALRMRGLRLRKELNQSLNQNSAAWKALNRPAPLHSASLSLAEMLRDIPQNDREHYEKVPLPNVTPYAIPTRECRRAPTRGGRYNDGILLLPTRNGTAKESLSTTWRYFETQYLRAEMISRTS